MYKSKRFIVTIALLGAYLLSACTGLLPQQDDSQFPAGSKSTEVVFTGTVEAMDGTQWLISGQQVDVEGSSIDTNIQVGDIVKVEATVSQDGSVFALKIESSGPDDTSANDNSSNTNDDNANSNDNTNSGNDNGNDNSNSNANSNDAAGTEQEVYGVVGAMGTSTITIDGVTYKLSTSTEFKDIISVGDQVKIHVIVNADGTLTIREIEKASTVGGDDNGNSNDNGDDDHSNSNSNDNNDDDHDNSNGNSNDNDDDDNHNSNDDSNSNDDD